jgi:hypothetical protein
MKSKLKNLTSLLYLIALIIFITFLFTKCDIQSTYRPIIHDTVFVQTAKQLTKLNVASLKVDAYYNAYNGNKMIDGIPAFVNGKETNSRWSVEGYPHFAVFYFDSLVTINKIRINLYKGQEGYTNHFRLYNFSDLLWEGDIGDSLWNNIHLNFYGSMIYLEVSGPSTKLIGKTNDWTDIGEVEFYGY